MFQKFMNTLVENVDSDPSHALVEASNDLAAGYKLASDLVKAETMTAEMGLQFFFYCCRKSKDHLEQLYFFYFRVFFAQLLN